MAARVVDGPEQNWLTLLELSKAIGLSRTTIREMVKAKPPKFPKPRRIGGKPLWSWRVVVWWEWKQEFEPPEGESAEENLGAPEHARARQSTSAKKGPNEA